MKRLILIALVCLLALPLVALAQAEPTPDVQPIVESTAVAPEPNIVMNGDGDVNIMQPPADTTPEPADDGSVKLPGWALLNLSGLLIALSAIVVIVNKVLEQRSLKLVLEHTSKAQKDAVEAAYEVVPDSAKAIIERGLNVSENLATEFLALVKFLKETTDGRPNTDPPPQG